MDINQIFEDFGNNQGWNSYLYRNRPYKGQMHTDLGERGRTEIKGISFRDLHDAFILAAFEAGNDQLTEEQYENVKKNKVTESDIYNLDLNKIDAMAWQQNMSIRIEKMMGIYPNVPQLTIGKDENEKN
jgi:hypothetical protein